MPAGAKQVVFADGSLSFSGGVDSIAPSTVQSPRNPEGIQHDQLCWLINATVRGGGILQSTQPKYLGTIHDGSAFYQGGMTYEPDFADPYLILCIGGLTYKVVPDLAGAAVNLTSAFPGTANSAAIEKAFFCQAEQFGIIQAGDNVSNPLFWDGAILRRSKGINNAAVAPGTPGVNEIPAGGPMDYYMGRLWWANGRQYSAGDIVKGGSGTGAYAFRDAVLNVTENPLVLGGDGFTVPTNAGNIRAIFHNANLDATLGQGQLMIGTRKAIYAQQVPVSRNDWIAADNNNQPQQSVVQINNGPVNDWSVVRVNGDVFYQTLAPSIASLFSARRDFGQWANRSLSANVQRAMDFVDRSLLDAASGCLFDNRLLMTTLPERTAQGIIHKGLLPLDFVPVSEFGKDLSPVWEGIMEGLDILQVFTGDFGGLERCFAVVRNSTDSSIELWELTDSLRYALIKDGSDKRAIWAAEFPAFTWGDEFMLKKLVSGELWLDKVLGTVNLLVEYRQDSDPCWKLWRNWEICSAKNSCEDVHNPICYPLEPFREAYRATQTLPVPKASCATMTGRPSDIAYQFQVRVTINGWCRIRGLLLWAEKFERELYANPTF